MIERNPAPPAASETGGPSQRARALWVGAILGILALLITCMLLVVIASGNA